MSACDGRCCVVLHVSRPLDQLRADSMAGNREAFKLSRMLLPITVAEAASLCSRNNIPGEIDNTYPHYRCKWWDEPTGLCTNYADRPAMCRQYPYDQPCSHCGETNAEAERHQGTPCTSRSSPPPP